MGFRARGARIAFRFLPRATAVPVGEAAHGSGWNDAVTSVKRRARRFVHDALQAASCGVQRALRGRVAACALLVGLLGGVARADAPVLPEPLSAAFRVLPLPAPLTLTDLYGELRGAHLHAGLDLRAALGTPVRTPRRGRVERVRTSGSGYGRSLYLRSDDGALLVFGHLDAFAPALAAHVDSLQRTSGLYEQDVWPPPGRFHFEAGDTVAWSGESGAGPPHLHVEVRHGDFALNPLRAGLPLADAAPPVIESLVLEPLDDSSFVAGQPRAWLSPLRAARETVTVQGRVRAYVRARDRVGGADGYAWSTALLWRSDTVEARLDSISWAGEMAELDWMVDRGQARDGRGLLLWAPAGWWPRLLRATAPRESEAGRIELRAGDRPLPLELIARDVAGHTTRRTVWLRGEPAGTPPRATPPRVREPDPAAGAWLEWTDGAAPPTRLAARLPEALSYAPTRGRLEAPARALREGDRVSTTPAVVPLRRAARLVAQLEPGALRQRGWGWSRVAFAGASAEWVGAEAEPASQRLVAEVSRLGTFTLVRDTLPPLLGNPHVVAAARVGPYSRWCVEAPVSDAMSGIDARASSMHIDGDRVPAEYDSDARVLRWRPLTRPRAAAIDAEVHAVDRAGRSARRHARLVLDSASRR